MQNNQSTRNARSYNRRVYYQVDPRYRTAYREALEAKFRGNRFLVVICVDHVNHRPIERAVMHLIDRYDSSSLLCCDETGNYALAPIGSPLVIWRRDADGLPSGAEARHKAQRMLAGRFPNWLSYQSGKVNDNTGKIVDAGIPQIELVKPARMSEMASYLYPVGKLKIDRQEVEKAEEINGRAS